MLIVIKESPRYHLLKNNFEEAFESLNSLQRQNKFYSGSEFLDEKKKSNLKISDINIKVFLQHFFKYINVMFSSAKGTKRKVFFVESHII